MTQRKRVLLFDFDGTVSLGDGPVLAYARAVASTLTAPTAETFLAVVGSALREDRAAGTADAGDHAPAPIDGYDLVRLEALAHGAAEPDLDRAYTRSRERLGTESAPITAPAGLAEFLAHHRASASVVLATNAPPIRIEDALGELGLTGAFDAVYTSVGKPDGLDTVLDEWLPRGELLSIGDVWVNDLAPAHRRGALTALIGPEAAIPADAQPTLSAGTLAELFPAISSWLSGPAPQHGSPTLLPPQSPSPPSPHLTPERQS